MCLTATKFVAARSIFGAFFTFYRLQPPFVAKAPFVTLLEARETSSRSKSILAFSFCELQKFVIDISAHDMNSLIPVINSTKTIS